MEQVSFRSHKLLEAKERAAATWLEEVERADSFHSLQDGAPVDAMFVGL